MAKYLLKVIRKNKTKLITPSITFKKGQLKNTKSKKETEDFTWERQNRKERYNHYVNKLNEIIEN